MAETGVAAFNADPQAVQALLACCASRRWAEQVAAGRPYRDVDALVNASERALERLDWADVERALEAHPRIGERARGTDREAGWSRSEQSGADGASEPVRNGLFAGNVVYEERFGHVFLICATGMTAESMLAALKVRLQNPLAEEREVVRDELAKIVRLRLAKLVDADLEAARS